MRVIDAQAVLGLNKPLGMNHTLAELRAIQVFVEKTYKGKYDVRFIAASASSNTNTTIAEVVRQYPETLVGAYLQIVPEGGRNDLWGYTSPAEIAKLAERPEIFGLNIVPPLLEMSINDPVLEQYVCIAAKKGITFMMHFSTVEGDDYTGVAQLDRFMDQYISKYPDLKVIIEHFGGLIPGQENKMLDRVRTYPDNLFLNTTGFSGELRRVGKNAAWMPRPEVQRYWLGVLSDVLDDDTVKDNAIYSSDAPWLGNRHPKFDPPHENVPVPYLTVFDQLKEAHQKQLNKNEKRVFDLEI